MKKVFIPTLAASLLVSSAALGAVSEEEIDELREQLAAMSQRLEALAAVRSEEAAP